MDSDATDFLIDILEFGEEAIFFAKGRDTERPEIERMRYLAIERLMELTSEALKRALKADPALVAEIPNISKIRGMRNRLAHKYDGIKIDIVWDAVLIHMPVLVEAVAAILQQRDEAEGTSAPAC